MMLTISRPLGQDSGNRRRLTDNLRRLGYTVPESQSNFVWCQNGRPPVRFTRLSANGKSSSA